MIQSQEEQLEAAAAEVLAACPNDQEGPCIDCSTRSVLIRLGAYSD